ncbi:MAG: hypothetical protein ACE5EC_07535, partial [Phycisphaerae bacterium]
MLVIKKKQIESFIAEDDTQLHRVISEIIRESFHESVGEYSDETLDSMVRIGIERAGTHGFERAEDIAAFVAVMFEISPERQAVKETNLGAPASSLGSAVLQTIAVCDVDLVHQSHISDEEELRFQMGVSVFGLEKDQHNGGTAYRWGEQGLHRRRG